MSFNFKRQQDIPDQYCVFGKIPRRADFVRINATHTLVVALDNIIAASIRDLKNDTERIARYEAMPASPFVFRSTNRQWLFIGVIQPSRDEGGRYYPLVAGKLIFTDDTQPVLEDCVLANELFFCGLREQLNNSMDNAVEMVACRQFLEEQSRFGSSSSFDVILAQQLLQKNLQMTRVSALEPLLQRSARGSLAMLMLAFMFYRQLLEKFGNSLMPQFFLLPLPAEDGGEVMAAAIWIALYRAATAAFAAGDEQCLWLQRPDGHYLLLIPGVLSSEIVALCLGAEIDDKHVIDTMDPDAPWQKHQNYAEAAYVLGRQLNGDDLTIAALCGVARNLSHSIAGY